MTENQQIDQWKNRRKMAWISFMLIFIVALPIIGLSLGFDNVATRVAKIGFFLGSIFGCWIAIVLAYFGGNALEHFKSGEK